ncbi:MAG: hypothetical protein ACRCVJ_00020 [Clostridium sp.]|uniref:hypothetical protein n=1 Tax=Clostridium sp. TaxID=1506 RepID=UPI003F317E87
MKFNEIQSTIIKLGLDENRGVVVKDFSSEERNKALRKKMFELLGTEKPDERDIYFHSKDLALIFTEVLEDDLLKQKNNELSNFEKMFVEERTVGLDEKVEFDIKNESYFTVGKISGNNWDLKRQRIDKGGKVTVDTDAYYIKMYDFLMRFLTEQITWAELMEQVAESIKKFKQDFISDKFSEAMDGIPGIFKYSGAYNKNTILSTVAKVEAANKGQKITLVGTKTALAKLQNMQEASNIQKDEMNDNGYIGKWFGYNCVALPNVFKDGTTDFAFDPDTIYVLASDNNKPVKIINRGRVLVKSIENGIDNMDMTMEFATIWRMGGAVLFTTGVGLLKITDQSK